MKLYAVMNTRTKWHTEPGYYIKETTEEELEDFKKEQAEVEEMWCCRENSILYLFYDKAYAEKMVEALDTVFMLDMCHAYYAKPHQQSETFDEDLF